jgi:hypothetical protein
VVIFIICIYRRSPQLSCKVALLSSRQLDISPQDQSDRLVSFAVTPVFYHDVSKKTQSLYLPYSFLDHQRSTVDARLLILSLSGLRSSVALTDC